MNGWADIHFWDINRLFLWASELQMFSTGHKNLGANAVMHLEANWPCTSTGIHASALTIGSATSCVMTALLMKGCSIVHHWAERKYKNPDKRFWPIGRQTHLPSIGCILNTFKGNDTAYRHTGLPGWRDWTYNISWVWVVSGGGGGRSQHDACNLWL